MHDHGSTSRGRPPLLPGERMPDIEARRPDGSIWRLAKNAPDFLLAIDVYRGAFCPRCRDHFAEMNQRAGELAELNLDVIAITADTLERVNKSLAGEWSFHELPIAAELSIDDARALGTFLSPGRAPLEPEVFPEPAVFIVRPDLTLLGAVYSTFAPIRPTTEQLLEVARTVHRRGSGYMPRGDLVL